MYIDPFAEEYDWSESTMPPGEHIVFVSHLFHAHSASGTPAVCMEFDCHDQNSPAYETRLIQQNFWLTDKAKKRFANMMRALRPEGLEGFNVTNNDLLSKNLLGRPVVITVKESEDTYQGETRTRLEVSRFRALNAEEQARMQELWGPSMAPPLS